MYRNIEYNDFNLSYNLSLYFKLQLLQYIFIFKLPLSYSHIIHLNNIKGYSLVIFIKELLLLNTFNVFTHTKKYTIHCIKDTKFLEYTFYEEGYLNTKIFIFSPFSTFLLNE